MQQALGRSIRLARLSKVRPHQNPGSLQVTRHRNAIMKRVAFCDCMAILVTASDAIKLVSARVSRHADILQWHVRGGVD